jgi:hypothetical protein
MDFRALQSLALRVAEALTLDDVFQRIVDGLAAQEAGALARVWLILPGETSETGEPRCLQLVASAGNSVGSAPPG